MIHYECFFLNIFFQTPSQFSFFKPFNVFYLIAVCVMTLNVASYAVCKRFLKHIIIHIADDDSWLNFGHLRGNIHCHVSGHPFSILYSIKIAVINYCLLSKSPLV